MFKGLTGVLGVLAPVASQFLQYDLQRDLAGIEGRTAAQTQIGLAQLRADQENKRRTELFVLGGLGAAALVVFVVTRG